MRAKKIDANQNDIVKKLRCIPGVSVLIISMVGKGCPDLLIGHKNKNFLIELKDGAKTQSRRKLTPDEEIFHMSWKGQADVCNSFDEVYLLITQ